MRPFLSTFFSPLWAGIILLAPFSTGAKEFLPNNLLENSPFIWEGFDPSKQKSNISSPRNSQAIELRGFYSINNTYRFNIFDTQSKKGTWIKKGEKKNGFEVIRFNTSTGTLILNVNGKRMTLTLKKPSKNPIPKNNIKKLSERSSKRESIRKRRNIKSRINKRRSKNIPTKIPSPPPGALTGTPPNIPSPPNMGKLGSNGLPIGIPPPPAEALKAIADKKNSSNNSGSNNSVSSKNATTEKSNLTTLPAFPGGLETPPDLPDELQDL